MQEGYYSWSRNYFWWRRFCGRCLGPHVCGFIFFILRPQLIFHCFISYSLDGKDVDDLQHSDDNESESEQDSDYDKKNTKLARSVGKKRTPTPAIESEDDDV